MQPSARRTAWGGKRRKASSGKVSALTANPQWKTEQTACDAELTSLTRTCVVSHPSKATVAHSPGTT